MTRTGMHVRAIEQLDEDAGTCVAFGFGRPELQVIPHPLRLTDLRAEGGIDEIRRMAAQPRKDSHDENDCHDTNAPA